MRKLLIALGVVILLFIAAALAVPFLIPADWIKDRVVTAIKSSTGRDFAINGPFRLHILPDVGVEAHDVTFANRAGAKYPAMATLDALDVGIGLLPLLSGNIEVKEFVLKQAVIHLEVDHSGQGNWAFASAPQSPAAPVPAAPSPQQAGGSTNLSDRLNQLRLGTVKLTDSSITYDNLQTGKSDAVTEVSASIKLPGMDSPFNLDAGATWHNQPITLSLALDKLRPVVEGGQTPMSVKIGGKPLELALDGTASGGAQTGFNGTIDFSIPSIRDLATWAGSPLNLPGTGLGPFSLKGKLSATGAKLTLSDVALALDAIKAQGGLSVDIGGAKPNVTGRLDVDTLDLNPYMSAPPPGGPQAAAPAAPASPAGWSDAPIDLSALRSAEAQLELSAKALKYGKIEVGQSALGIVLTAGKLTATLSKFALYDGSGSGDVVLDGSGAENGLEASFKLAGVKIEPLLTAAMNFTRLTGTGQVDFAVTSHGKSQKALMSALNGTAAMNLADGAIKGINIAAMMRNVGTAFTSAGGDEKTDFASLGGTATITDGIVKNTDLALQSPLLRVQGSGTVNLPERTVDYRLEPKLVASAQGQGGAGNLGGVQVPIIIQGPWDHLSYRPDLAAMLQQKLNPSQILKGVTGGQGSSSNPAGMLKGLFGH